MKVLLITPHKNEAAPYYLRQKVGMIRGLGEEIPARNETISVDILPLHEYAVEDMSIREIKALLNKYSDAIDNADIVHSFSELPLFFSNVFRKTLVLSLNLEKRWNDLRRYIPEDGIPGTVVTSTLANDPALPYQELLPGFTIEKPSGEFDRDSKDVIIFATDTDFAGTVMAAVRQTVPDATFHVRFRDTAVDTPSGTELFSMEDLRNGSFVFAVAQAGSERDIDLLPLTVLSRGIPVFSISNPFEKRFYPDFLQLSSPSDIPGALQSIHDKFSDRDNLVDELHSHTCRFFFFSKMADDIIRLYNTTLNNYRREDSRPWGYWEALKLASTYKVKHFFVKDGEELSLQKHKHRDEIWTVADGEGTVHIDGETFEVNRGDVYMIKKEQKHRASGKGRGLHVIELQLGDYLGEDDIVRLQDKYGRK